LQVIDFGRDLLCEIRNDDLFDGAAVLAFFFLPVVFPASTSISSLLPSLSIPYIQQAMPRSAPPNSARAIRKLLPTFGTSRLEDDNDC
jgi:uncharacterized BrkB/YihY/UPF0761 family membrane protein